MPDIFRPTRRAFIAGTAAAPLLRAAQSKPNVLLFITDQESELLPGPVKRPASDSLRTRGATFTHAFCNTPQCSPARAALMTGLEPHKAGVLTNVDATSLGKPLAAGLPTIGTVFRDAGYRTAYFGKWHLEKRGGPSEKFGFMDSREGTDDAVARDAGEWIGKQTEPWLAVVSILNPHNIYDITNAAGPVPIRESVKAPSTLLSDLASRPAAQMQYMREDQGKPTLEYAEKDWLRYRSFYCGLVEKADRCLASLLSAIPSVADTVVAYTSDHGDALGEHGLPFKGPFLYEPLIRIPLVLAGPGLQAGSTRQEMVTSVDIGPTIAGCAGIRWPGAIDGRDFSKGGGRDEVYLEYYGKQKWVTPIRTLRTKRWKLSSYGSGEYELYDLKNDAVEAKNLADRPNLNGLRQQMMDKLDRWWTGA